MKNKDLQSICLVDYESGSSVIHEYMTRSDFNKLLKEEKKGFVHIMRHTDLRTLNK